MKYIALFITVLTVSVIGIAIYSPVAALNLITPSDNFDLEENIRFGEDPRFSLDIYHSKTALETSPLIVFSHGGAWKSGDKNMYKFIGDGLASEGFTTVIYNYRLHPNTRFPDPITDGSKAIAWTARRFAERPIILMGHSAGAYNVLMNGLNAQYLSNEGIDKCARIAGVVSLSGPTGIKPLTEEPAMTIFPDHFTKQDAAMNNVSEPLPPILLLHGAKDTRVYPDNARQLGAKITAHGGEAKVIIYPELDHTGTAKVLSRYFENDSTLKADLVGFIKRQSQRSENYCQ